MEFDFLNNVNSGVALAVLGYFGFIFKDIPFRILGLLEQKFSISIQADNEHYFIYKATSDYCISRFPELKKHIKNEASYSGSNVANENIACGTYYFLYDWCTLAIVSKSFTQQNSTYSVKYMIDIIAIGLHREKLLNEYKTSIKSYFPDMTNNITFTSFTVHGESCLKIIPKKRFDDVFYKYKDDVINIIENFKKSKDLYEKHGIIYKTGFLFYGSPGSGKSTLARAIASYLGWNLYSLSRDLSTFGELSNVVILIEDIDCIVDNREDVQQSSKSIAENLKNLENMSLQEVLNFIDGAGSPNNVIFVATTNYIDRIDPALKRKGRFDHIFEIPYIDKDLGKEMCKRYDVDESVLDNFNFPVSAADIQAEIFYNKIAEEGHYGKDVSTVHLQ